MWQRRLDWAATVFVGVFGVLWVGVVAFAAFDAAMWSRIGQGVFGTFLVGWSLHKAGLLLRRTLSKVTARHRGIGV
ncbi:hypothetical protein [Streptosporangium roseum]|uniref:Uncharacterized protein n=1 Tax=Streptosporangium roseum (strain ATCC 12428 / DSM 43021 / JCM 3005 / KCTC 9067 / NCIMB 10171 / NRRL 2505 / NI 9100) TaxID=479432 RepID=D2B0H6_STRRD|nr:hypothetical protein [Streptosporangium roseum]ACZ90988.1 hypothetical protein Sros_8340 [Streptosporangium roseum DSM 43021]